MTELEIQLLNALENLQSEQEKRYSELEMVCKDLRQMFERTSAENREITKRLNSLTDQLNSLKRM